MIHSMTGFGKAITELPNRKITVEIKSLNSKQLDLSTRIPAIYREKEMEIRSEIRQKIRARESRFFYFYRKYRSGCLYSTQYACHRRILSTDQRGF